jgi:hypothetical protein
MPTTVHLFKENKHLNMIVFADPDVCKDAKEYTPVHNNPDYYVIKKSDVQGDVLDALSKLDFIERTSEHREVKCLNMVEQKKYFQECIKTIRNALIAQTNMVAIPRDVLEGMKYKPPYDSLSDHSGYNEAVDEILNYKKDTQNE